MCGTQHCLRRDAETVSVLYRRVCTEQHTACSVSVGVPTFVERGLRFLALTASGHEKLSTRFLTWEVLNTRYRPHGQVAHPTDKRQEAE